jgi:hypothetical protein
MRQLLTLAALIAVMLGFVRPTWAQTTPSVSGTVQQYLLNPHGEVEGVLLKEGTVVRFPPHLGTAVAGTAKPGDEVIVVGFFGPATPHGQVVKALTITNTKTGQTVTDQPPTTPPLPPDMRGLTLTPLTVQGTVAHVLTNERGEVDGLILSGGEEVKFPPDNGAVVAMMVEQQAGKTVEASGYGTQNAFGTAVDALSLTMNGQAIPLTGPGRPPR